MAKRDLSHIAFYLPGKDDLRLVDVERFGTESRRIQFEVLSELRRRASNDNGTVSVAIAALGLAVFALVGPRVIVGWGDDPLTNILLSIMLGLLILAVLIPVLVVTARQQNRREKAIVWLRGYEDELRRRARMPGASGRAWRRAH